MSSLFEGKTDFNEGIGSWDMSEVTDMSYIFTDNYTFSQHICEWDVSSVTNMSNMFLNSDFNQDISDWCVAKIPSEPTDFSEKSPLKQKYKPDWGTCPE